MRGQQPIPLSSCGRRFIRKIVMERTRCSETFAGHGKTEHCRTLAALAYDSKTDRSIGIDQDAAMALILECSGGRPVNHVEMTIRYKRIIDVLFQGMKEVRDRSRCYICRFALN
ncbi:hypothetical protein H845_3559 (plasmid) [Komagataeibacter xylinus E25]|nr:hypothetical protein H845_3559 [Komagataeibacter xylinus E25]